MDGLKRYLNDDRFRVDGDKNMRLLAFAFTIVFVWTGSEFDSSRDAFKHVNKSLGIFFTSYVLDCYRRNIFVYIFCLII